MTVMPADGRDDKTAAAAKADWEAGQEFIIADLFQGQGGRYVNRTQLTPGEAVTIRYARLTKAVVVTA